MGKNKLKKFAAIFTFPNVFENFNPRDPKLAGKDGEITELKGQWAKKFFKNENPIVLELACGGGEYTVGLSKIYPDINFIGLDIKGSRIFKGASEALEKGYKNVAFVRTRIEQIDHFFAENEVDQIWITFPDPFLRNSKSNRRLTSPFYRAKYKKLLKKDGIIHLKTDSNILYAYTLSSIIDDPSTDLLYKNDNIYAHPLLLEELNIKTYYELMHLERGRYIKYLQFTI
jgi:tRNA (guanine-N7-)-methyltransferase